MQVSGWNILIIVFKGIFFFSNTKEFLDFQNNQMAERKMTLHAVSFQMTKTKLFSLQFNKNQCLSLLDEKNSLCKFIGTSSFQNLASTSQSLSIFMSSSTKKLQYWQFADWAKLLLAFFSFIMRWLYMSTRQHKHFHPYVCIEVSKSVSKSRPISYPMIEPKGSAMLVPFPILHFRPS